ncbi:hypothetical protein [Hymenobacter ruricola]|uniref:PAS domain-containing protein n=1 Tax=Hymenobacter ruricola TaxID=2791023 RepID=A0ABS0I1W8_9BACT|nr:hypothetical protein [Hymenobacter ruricola]MBF9220622.1 hypothetical protein [Hymenobacter ruricola]
MKFPRTAEDVENEILNSVNKYGQHQGLRIGQLTRVLQKANPEIIVEGVIRILERRSNADTFSQQELAGRVLEIVQPKSQKDLKEVLQRVLKGWDKSVEQFPFWLRNNYGINELKVAFAELELTEMEKDKLQTLKWWLRLN